LYKLHILYFLLYGISDQP